MTTETSAISVRFSYKTNPAQYESVDASITLTVPRDMSPGVCMSAARAMVYTTLGMKVETSDRVAAKEYLAKMYGSDARLSDFE